MKKEKSLETLQVMRRSFDVLFVNFSWKLLRLFFCMLPPFSLPSQCLKITEKVAFNIASEASYVYILSGQKLIKNAKIEKLKYDILSVSYV